MAGPAIDDEREPGAIVIEDEPFDVVRANSSLEDGSTPSPRKIRPWRNRAKATTTTTKTNNYEVGDLPALSRSEEGSEVDVAVSKDTSNIALMRNVTGGRSARTRPLSPPSRAGLDDPEVYQRNLASSSGRYTDEEEDDLESPSRLVRGPSYRNEMPMDERQEYEEEMKALALCGDLGDSSQGVPEFCDSALTAVNDLCASGLSSMGGMATSSNNADSEAVQLAKAKVGKRRPNLNLKLGDKHTSNKEGNVEEQTAIEVEYVEPLYRCKNDGSSPRRKNALLKAMTRKAKDDWKGKGGSVKSPRNTNVARGQEDVVEAALNELADQPDDNVYATFTNAEKRKFLQLINGGNSPFEATSRVLKERVESPAATTGGGDVSSVADSSFQSGEETNNLASPPRSGRKSRKLAFWRKGKQNKDEASGSTLPESAPSSAPSTPGRSSVPPTPTSKNNEIYEDSDGDSSCEKVGDEIKKFLQEEAESVKSGSVGAASPARSREEDHRFQKSGISYYDAVRKDRSMEEEDAYYNDGQYPEDAATKRQTRKIKLPKGFGGFSKFKNRATPVPEEEDGNPVIPQASFDNEEKKNEESPRGGAVVSPQMPDVDDEHVAVKSPKEIVDDLNMNADLDIDVYMGSTRQSHGGIGNSRSFDGGNSVVSGKSHKTSGTNFTTQSTRSRRVGQAKVRMELEKSVLNTSTESSRTRGWQESIEAMAAQTGKVWDPETGWKDYVDPKQLDNSTDGFYSQSVDVSELRRNDTEDSAPTNPSQLPVWRNTRKPPTTPTRKGPDSRKPISPIRGRKSPKNNNRPPPVQVEEKPRGWAATMKAATAKLNLQGKKWDPEKGWTGLSEAEAHSVAETLRVSNQDIAETASSDMQDFGTTVDSMQKLDEIANKQDKSMQFLSEDEDAEANHEAESASDMGDHSTSAQSSSNPSGKYMQIAETGSVQEYQRGKNRSRPVIVRKQGLNSDDANFFPEGSNIQPIKGPVDLDDVYEQETANAYRGQGQKDVISGPSANQVYRKIYESQGTGSFDDAVGTDFSWDADEDTEAIDNTDTRKAVPRLRIKIRDSAKNSGSKALSEASFESGTSIPKLAAPKRDTSPIRGSKSRDEEAPAEISPEAEPQQPVKEEIPEQPIKETIQQVPPPPPENAASNPTASRSPVAELHKMWEKRTKSWDKNMDQQRQGGEPSQDEKGAPNSEWKSFLAKKVQAESAAAAPSQDERDSVFDFDGENKPKNNDGAFDDLSELSPIRQQDESDSEYGTRTSTVASEASTSIVQGTTFLQRLQACAAPIVTKGSELAKSQNCNADGNIATQFAALRNNPDKKGAIMQASAGLCGKNDTLSEVGEDDSTFQSSVQTPTSSIRKDRSRSNPRSRQSNKDEMSSVVSDGFGAQSAYLEAIAMKAATGGKKKKKRSQGSEVSAASAGKTSEVSGTSSAANSKHSEKFQQFLDRRASREASPPQEKPPRAEVSDRAERYASEKVNEMMGSMADRDNRETGAFPTATNTNPPNDASRMAAEELAAARVEVMMQTLSSQNLEDNEAEI